MGAKEDFQTIKALVNHWVEDKYQEGMYIKGLEIYHKYSKYKNLKIEEGKKFNPLELSINEIIFEVNSRFRK